MYDPQDTKPTTKVTTFGRGLVDQREGRRLTVPKAVVMLPDRENRRLNATGPYNAEKEQAAVQQLKDLRTEEKRSASGVRYIEVERIVKVPAPKKKGRISKLFGK